MRFRLVSVVAVVIVAAAVLVAVSRLVSGGAGALPTTPASYLGVYESGALTNYQLVNNFTGAAGKQPNLVGYYSGWNEPFQTSFAETASKHGAATIMQWDPTDISVSQIAAGDYDAYLRSFDSPEEEITDLKRRFAGLGDYSAWWFMDSVGLLIPPATW